ncbi:MAG: ATP synthase F1 subunit delta [Gemmatimonadetes bacterium]|nr:ATP synthase F1 subunit delta [Gemmatimonadota bacterium]
MREPTIARNYAEALFASGEKSGAAEQYGFLLEAVAGAIASDLKVQAVLATPQVSKPQKQAILSKALEGRAPEPFIRFLGAVIRRGRQGMIGAISREYLALVDIKLDRVHAGVTIAREPDEKLKQEISKRLSEVLGTTVLAHFRTDRAILGGLIVRVGDRVMDGSLRRKLVSLRRQMLGG